MNPRDLPILPGPGEIIELWPMLAVMALFILIWLWSDWMNSRSNRWNRMHRRQRIMFAEDERHRTMLLK